MLTLLYWRVGQRVRSEVLGSNHAAYGNEIVVTLSLQLSLDHCTSFGEKNPRRIIQFAEVFPDEPDCRIAATRIELNALH